MLKVLLCFFYVKSQEIRLKDFIHAFLEGAKKSNRFASFTNEITYILQVVETIGDLLVAQWSGPTGDEAMRLFGDFCSKHTEIINTYKTLSKNDKKFAAFTKVCIDNCLSNYLN